MKIKKSDGYDDYKVEMSFKELMAFKAAGQSCGDPIGDECAKAISWFFSSGDVPPPGVSKDDEKELKEFGEEVDEILPSDQSDSDDAGGPKLPTENGPKKIPDESESGPKKFGRDSAPKADLDSDEVERILPEG